MGDRRPLYLAEMADWPPLGAHARLARRQRRASAATCSTLLRRSGPLLSRDIPDTCAVPWASTGWTNNRNVTQMLEFLTTRGEVAVAGRVGPAAAVGPAPSGSTRPCDVVPADDARRIRERAAAAALGIARAKSGVPVSWRVGEAGEPAEVEGATGEWRVDPEATRRGLRRPHRAAVAVRPARPRPGPRPRAVRLRVHARDVQAEGRRAAGATSRSRCSTTTGSSARSTPPPTARRQSCGCTRSTRTSGSPAR